MMRTEVLSAGQDPEDLQLQIPARREANDWMRTMSQQLLRCVLRWVSSLDYRHNGRCETIDMENAVQAQGSHKPPASCAALAVILSSQLEMSVDYAKGPA